MKWRAQAFNVLLSSARQRLTPLFFQLFPLDLGREKGRGNPITPHSARLLVLRESSSETAVQGSHHGQSHGTTASGREREAAHHLGKI